MPIDGSRGDEISINGLSNYIVRRTESPEQSDPFQLDSSEAEDN